MAKCNSNNEISLSFPAAICSVPTTLAISHFYQTCGLIPSMPRGRRRRGKRWEGRKRELGCGAKHSCSNKPSLQPASTAPRYHAESCKKKGQTDNLDKYLIVTGFTSPSLLQSECLTPVTPGTHRAAGELLQPLLVQGEQAEGYGGHSLHGVCCYQATSSATSITQQSLAGVCSGTT